MTNNEIQQIAEKVCEYIAPDFNEVKTAIFNHEERFLKQNKMQMRKIKTWLLLLSGVVTIITLVLIVAFVRFNKLFLVSLY